MQLFKKTESLFYEFSWGSHGEKVKDLFRFAWHSWVLVKARTYGREANLATAFHLWVSVVYFARLSLGLSMGIVEGHSRPAPLKIGLPATSSKEEKGA